MTVSLLRAKLHRIRVTEANLDYEGSLTVDADLMDAVGMFAYERVLVADVENGNRFETYLIPGSRGSGICCLNGAAAHKGAVGDRLIVMAFAQMSSDEAVTFVPNIGHLDENNRLK